MSGTKNYMAIILVLLALVMIVMSMFIPRLELPVSISIRLLSSALALYIVIKYREWRVIFLSIMFFLMATRQILTSLIWSGVIEGNELTNTLSELPGSIVTLLSLLSIIYLGLILSGNIRIMRRQEKSIRTLNALLPICANCKKIRNDEGYWKEIETYLRDHTDSQLSHSLCEECARKLYGKEEWYR